MIRFLVALLSIALFLFSPAANADLVMTIGSPADIGTDDDVPVGPFLAGEPVSIQVFAHLEAPISPPLTSYLVTIDVGGDEDGVPDDFRNLNFVSNVGGTLVVDDALSGPLPIDVSLNWLGSSAISQDADEPTLLFTINFDTLASTPAGVYDIEFGNDIGSNALSGFTANGSNFTSDNLVRDNGQFFIAIPEPASTLIVMTVGSTFAIRRRKKN